MNQRVVFLSVMIVAMLLMSKTTTTTSMANASPNVTIELLNPPVCGVLELDIGESYTFDIRITSSEPFVLAMAMTSADYPGRGVFWHGSDRATHGTNAELHLTMTGKKSTSDPLLVSISAGVRYKGGIVVSEIFTFSVVVP